MWLTKIHGPGVLVTFLSFVMLSTSLYAKHPMEGEWEAVLKAPTTDLPLVIHLKQEAEKWQGSLDTPSQGGFDIPMTKVMVTSDSIKFQIANMSIHYEGKLNKDNGSIEGTFIQGTPYKLDFSRPGQKAPKVATNSTHDDIVDTWTGIIEIPGNPLTFVLHIKEVEGKLQATSDSPDQGSQGMKVDTIVLQSGEVIFTMAALDVRFEGILHQDKTKISGKFAQKGFVFQLVMARGNTAPKALSARPQTPKPPFNYQVTEVTVANHEADLTLAGTLTLPKAGGVKAAAILITGSGPQDRDETMLRHKPFAVIADHLTKQGYAVLRLDDRGVGNSTGNFTEATWVDFVSDINAAVDYLKTHTDIPKQKIGLIGHSEGGMVAARLASQRDDLAFIILLAAPGIANADLFAEQRYLIAKTHGMEEALLQKMMVFDKRIFALLNQQPMNLPVNQKPLLSLAKQRMQLLNLTEEAQTEGAEALINTLSTQWFRAFLRYDPDSDLRKVSVPILALNGTLDLQVAAESNLGGIRNSLSKAQHPDFTLREFNGLNHLFQSSTTGSPDEYASIEETFAPVALEAMSDWLNQRSSSLK